MKIYVHHFYNKTLDYKFTHNLINVKREANLVSGQYAGNDFEFIFDPELNDNSDGYHLIDWYSCEREKRNQEFRDPKIGSNSDITLSFLKYCNAVLKERTNWIITLFRGEKILIEGESFENSELELIEKEMKLLEHHFIMSDNYFIDPYLHQKYPNFFYPLSNVIFQWNESWAIRWYVEVGEIHKRLNFDWDLIYSIRNHKISRIKNMIAIKKLNLDRVLLQRSDSLRNERYYEYDHMLDSIRINSIHIGSDFDKLDYIKGHDGYLDAFFRVLLKAKMILLDESWHGFGIHYRSQYLSEKTIGVVLGGIPFIPVHTYPLEILHGILDLKKHPFHDRILTSQSSPEKLANFIRDFMNDFRHNMLMCQGWVNESQFKMLEVVRTQNSMLDVILSDFKINRSIERNLF